MVKTAGAPIDLLASCPKNPGKRENIKRMAAEEGLPYQTYITSILHKLCNGRLRDERSHL